MSYEEGRVVPLETETTPAAPPPPSRPGTLHGLAITGMALSALIGIGALLAFVTVSWPDGARRYVVGTIVLSIGGFLCFSFGAVIAAARETYKVGRSEDHDG